MELAPRARRWLIASGTLLSLVLVVALARSLRRDRVEGHAFDIPASGRGVVVEVLNGSGRSGMARLGARHLRRVGFDVVYFGTADSRVDTTQVLVRRGDADNGDRVRNALGAGRVVTRIDTLRRVDVTVILGPDFQTDEQGRP